MKRTRVTPLNLGLGHRLLALSIGTVIATAGVLVVVGAWQSDKFSTAAAGNVAELIQTDTDHVTSGVSTLTRTAGEAIQESVNSSMNVANAELAQRGGLRLDGSSTTSWKAVNQLTQEATDVTLPRAEVSGTWLGQNRDQSAPTPLVDDIRSMVSATVTVFQKMDDKGDLLRVATNVPNKAGERAIGTYIPATAQDGTPNAVAKAINSGTSYRGVAKVVDTWYIAAYDPIKNANGDVIGALYVGIPQDKAIAQLSQAISDTTVGANGRVTVYSTSAADKGRIIASTGGKDVGTTNPDATDANGVKYVDEIVSKATSLGAGQVFNAIYQLPGLDGEPAAASPTNVVYYGPYQWAIAVSSYGPDSAGAIEEVEQGRSAMLWAFVVAAVLIAAAAALVALIWARRMTARLRGLTSALTALSERDLTVQAKVGGNDEIGEMGTALNTAVGELRELMSGISEASLRVEETSRNVSSTGAKLSDSASSAAEQTSNAAEAAAEVTRNVQTVAHSSTEMGSAIAEISRNTQAAAATAHDSVERTRQASDVIAELSAASAEITDVVRTISSIAEQTNLLALNATIEAARAGDAGKGFAVVAGEVKDLAQETARATEDVSRRVEAINSGTTRAIESIAAITTAIDSVNESQSAIAAAVEEQSATTDEVNRSISLASDHSSQIAVRLNQVSSTVESTRDAVRMSADAAEELSGTARQLTDLVGRFTL
ncbi:MULTISPECIES: methyl-accepting chemotaxis protein [Actinosynnema]|uniref:methyl-accepting chemotaxis protein n=1 Tax=Actinosynnema TaxID=40566 RepID=UPI0020A4BD7B|nr:methyl-accepting chemotaxis protein [Actinosynnema pretiosum]MCP2093309.1 Methyl-accepting chemotaxis protein [Actinosynnema pretiosum]